MKNTSIWRNNDVRMMVSCGCFTGDIDAFAIAVERTHGDNEHGAAYKALITYAKTALWIGSEIKS